MEGLGSGQLCDKSLTSAQWSAANLCSVMQRYYAGFLDVSLLSLHNSSKLENRPCKEYWKSAGSEPFDFLLSSMAVIMFAVIVAQNRARATAINHNHDRP